MSIQENVPDRLKALEDIEKMITTALNNAALALQELGKERPVERNLDRITERYVENLNKIESDTLAQINYLTQVATSQNHEGSCYGTQKRVQLLRGAVSEIEARLGNMVINGTQDHADVR